MKLLGVSRMRTVFLLLLVCGLTCLLVVFKFTTNVSRRNVNRSWSRPAGAAGNDTTLNTSACRTIKHIYYLKTHKTASSTLANMLVRYGLSRNLTFVLRDLETTSSFNWPKRFHLSSGSPLYSDRPNLIYNHMRYNKGPINWLFPKQKSKYITIIRNPVDNFNSAFAFFRLVEKLKLTGHSDPLNTFLKSPGSYKEVRHATKHHRLFLHVRNPMLFDMGLDHEYFRNLTAVQSYIRFLDKEFDLVLIADYFDESLVLLKRLLCWEFEDIAYMKLRIRKVKPQLKEEVRRKILDWNWAEALLFDHFNKTLWKKILNAGPQFAADLQTFRRLNQHYEDACSSKKSGPVEKELSQKCVQMKKIPAKFRHDMETNNRRHAAERIQNDKEPDVPADSLEY